MTHLPTFRAIASARAASPVRIRQIAHRVLAEPRFHPATPWWQHAVNSISNLLNHLLLPYSPLLMLPAGSGLAATILAVVAVGAGLLWAVRGMSLGDRRLQRVRPALSSTGPAWMRIAEEHANAGRFNQEVIARYRMVVDELAARHLLDAAVGHTTGEYRQTVAASRPEAAASFTTLTDLFEQVRYGGVGLREPDAVIARRAGDETLSAVGVSPRRRSRPSS